MLFFFLIMFLFLIYAGALTLLESKLIAIVQGSVSNVKFSFQGTVQFFLDFFKLLNKNSIIFVLSHGKMVMSTSFLITSMLMGLLIGFVLILTSYYEMSHMVVMLVMNLIYVVSKSFATKESESFFSNLFVPKLSTLVNLVEVFLFAYDFTYSVMFNGNSLEDFVIESMFSEDSVETTLNSMFVCLLIKALSNPFDYMESESEGVNSAFLDTEGLLFSIWTLIEYMSIMSHLGHMVFIYKVMMGLDFVFCLVGFYFYSILICLMSALMVSADMGLIQDLANMLNILYLYLLLDSLIDWNENVFYTLLKGLMGFLLSF